MRLFEGVGVELEYMIVRRDTLDVLPVSDQVLRAVAGEITSEVECGELAWSNELVLHVIELKTNGPAASLSGLAELFHRDVLRINRLLEPLGGQLLPTAMHPWMDPDTETRLWPHDYNEVYEAFDRIFSCRGHGWSNLQSVHLNLPFADDDEFGRLHAAIRMILPILPALAASSPVLDGRVGPSLDNRLEAYRGNARRVPSVSGEVIPEQAFSEADYRHLILGRIYDDLSSLDPGGVLREEWVNARGAIARFGRKTIEIRLLDVQECPRADVAICAAVTEVIRALVEGRWAGAETLRSVDSGRLSAILAACTREADQAWIRDSAYLEAMGCSGGESCRAGALWTRLCEATVLADERQRAEHGPALQVLLRKGPLARRILGDLGSDPDRAALMRVYRKLGECLTLNRLHGESD